MDFDTDVLIVGAGPAGLSAASTLAGTDLDYLLLAKENSPCEEKTCGGFVPRRALDEFDIPPINGQHEIHSLRMKFPSMDLIRVDFDRSVGINITRGDLGRTMLALIPNSDQHVRMNSKVQSIKVKHDRAEATVSSQDKDEVVTAQVIIDCSGTNSISSRFKLIRPRIDNNSMGYGLQLHMQKSKDGEG